MRPRRSMCGPDGRAGRRRTACSGAAPAVVRPVPPFLVIRAAWIMRADEGDALYLALPDELIVLAEELPPVRVDVFPVVVEPNLPQLLVGVAAPKSRPLPDLVVAGHEHALDLLAIGPLHAGEHLVPDLDKLLKLLHAPRVRHVAGEHDRVGLVRVKPTKRLLQEVRLAAKPEAFGVAALLPADGDMHVARHAETHDGLARLGECRRRQYRAPEGSANAAKERSPTADIGQHVVHCFSPFYPNRSASLRASTLETGWRPKRMSTPQLPSSSVSNGTATTSSPVSASFPMRPWPAFARCHPGGAKR